MFSRLNVFKIITDHLKCFKYKSNLDKIRIGIFFLMPLIPSFMVVSYKTTIAKETINIIVSVLSIFVGLLLNLLVLIFDLVKDKKKRNEHTIYFIDSVKETITHISFAILVSVIGIILLLCNLTEPWWLSVSMGLAAISYYCVIEFFITLIMILRKIYILFIDEINNKN